MKKIISITKVVDRFASGPDEVELRATADAQYDEAKSELIVQLKSFVYPERCATACALSHPDWLSRHQIVNSRVSLEETIPATRDIFHSWVRKLAQSIKSLNNA